MQINISMNNYRKIAFLQNVSEYYKQSNTPLKCQDINVWRNDKYIDIVILGQFYEYNVLTAIWNKHLTLKLSGQS